MCQFYTICSLSNDWNVAYVNTIKFHIHSISRNKKKSAYRFIMSSSLCNKTFQYVVLLPNDIIDDDSSISDAIKVTSDTTSHIKL